MQTAGRLFFSQPFCSLRSKLSEAKLVCNRPPITRSKKKTDRRKAVCFLFGTVLAEENPCKLQSGFLFSAAFQQFAQ